MDNIIENKFLNGIIIKILFWYILLIIKIFKNIFTRRINAVSTNETNVR